MCGIFAAVGKPPTEAGLQNVFAALHHRGPDGRGVFRDEAASVAIAHTRLAIIDLVTGEQPIASEDGEIVLSANGEIYEFERIRRTLERKGYSFRTKSDSEVINYIYK
jgi:asparagine synthase (glutamine-hydrolysing)